MVNDPSKASLLQFLTTLLTFVILRLWQSCVRMFLFLPLMNPRVPTSRGMLRHLNPLPWMVVVSINPTKNAKSKKNESAPAEERYKSLFYEDLIYK